MENNKERKIAIKNMIIAFCVMVAVILLIAIGGFFVFKPEKEIFMGQAEAPELRISGKVPGRVVKFLVEEGDYVHAGDTLVLIPSPEVAAKKEQAEAMHHAIDAQRVRQTSSTTTNHARENAYEAWQQAIRSTRSAQETYDRMQRLSTEGVIPTQRVTDAKNALEAAKAAERTAKRQYDLARSANNSDGTDMLTAALMDYSLGTLSEVGAYEREGALIAPIDGVISEIFPQEGELVGTGAPIMNIVNMDKMTVRFHVREDMLPLFTPGTTFTAFVPALENREVLLQVTKLKDMGSYAVWKATKMNGQYDLKTFEVVAQPTVKIEGLHPGMSVIYKYKGEIKKIKVSVE